MICYMFKQVTDLKRMSLLQMGKSVACNTEVVCVKIMFRACIIALGLL